MKRKPCKNCPFRKTNQWAVGGLASKALALQILDENYIKTGKDNFSCHMLNPDNHIFSMGEILVNDCAGYRMMKENMQVNNTHAAIVNSFSETSPLPGYDLRHILGFDYQSPLHLI